jgi:hypothetical protein
MCAFVAIVAPRRRILAAQATNTTERDESSCRHAAGAWNFGPDGDRLNEYINLGAVLGIADQDGTNKRRDTGAADSGW